MKSTKTVDLTVVGKHYLSPVIKLNTEIPQSRLAPKVGGLFTWRFVL